MGATLSQNVSKIILKSIEKTTNEIVKTNLLNYQQSNIITIQNSENVDISNNINIQTVKVNMRLLSTELQKSENRININEDISQSCKSLIKGLNLLNVSDSKNLLTNLIQTSIIIKNKSILECKFKTKQSIKINIKNSKNIKIANNINKQYINTIQSCVENISNENKNLQKIEQKIGQVSDTKLEGLSMSFIATIILCGFLMVFSFGVFGSYYLTKFIIPITTSILSYIFYKKSYPVMINYNNETSFKNIKSCKNLKLKEINNIGLEDIQLKCLSDTSCTGFEWQQKLKKGYIFKTKNINNNCLKDAIMPKQLDNKKITKYPRIKIINDNVQILNNSADTMFFDNYANDIDIIFLTVIGEIWVNKNTTFEHPLSVIKTKKYWNSIFCFDPEYKTIVIFDQNIKIIEDSLKKQTLSQEEKNSIIVDISDSFCLQQYKIQNSKFVLEKKIPFVGMVLDFNSDDDEFVFSIKKYKNIYLYLSILFGSFTLIYICYEFYKTSKEKNLKTILKKKK